MKKLLIILIYLLTFNTFTFANEKGWFKATKTDFPIDQQNLENPKYTMGRISSSGKKFYSWMDVLNVFFTWEFEANTYYSKGANCRIILIPVQYVEGGKWENKDDTEYYISVYHADVLNNNNMTLYLIGLNSDGINLDWYKSTASALKFKLKWDNDNNATFVCGDKMIMHTMDLATATSNKSGNIHLVSPNNTTYTYYPFYLFMEKEIIEWKPGFRKGVSMEELMAGPEALAIRDGYLADINNTFSIMASDKPTKILLSGTLSDASSIKWSNEQESLSIEPKEYYPELDYNTIKWDFPFYDGLTITPSPELIGKSYKFILLSDKTKIIR